MSVDQRGRTGDAQTGGDTLAAAATRELAEAFAATMRDGNRERFAWLLAEDVAFRSPGRHSVSGTHRGRSPVIAALTPRPAPGVNVDSVELTDLLVDDSRAVVVIELHGAEGPDRFQFEIAFHLQSDGETIIGITEYGGDQYTMDRLIGSAPPTSDSSSGNRGWRRPWTMWRRFRGRP